MRLSHRFFVWFLCATVKNKLVGQIISPPNQMHSSRPCFPGESFNNTIHSESAYWEKRLPDPHLSSIGIKQAQCLADWLKSARAQLINRVDEFWVSPMLRAIQTAIPVGR